MASFASEDSKLALMIVARPIEHIETAVLVIRHLDPHPGLRFSGPGARAVEPDVYIFKEGDDWIIELNDDDLPQLRLNTQYRKMLDKDAETNKDVRNYVKERFTSALMLLKNIEQRKQTIMKTCQAIVGRQGEFLEHGIDALRPMMIKDVAEEIGVHPSTVSRAVSSKYVHTPHGVYELRFFFSEAVQGPSGSATPLLLLKRKVKKMIEEEDTAHPLTDDQITARLNAEGIEVTRRTVAKYREDLKIPSTHQRSSRLERDRATRDAADREPRSRRRSHLGCGRRDGRGESAGLRFSQPGVFGRGRTAALAPTARGFCPLSQRPALALSAHGCGFENDGAHDRHVFEFH